MKKQHTNINSVHVKKGIALGAALFFALNTFSQGINTNAIKLNNTGQALSIQPASGMSSSYTITLPANLPSSNGQVLTSTTAGSLNWTTASTVSSIGVILPSVFNITNSPVTNNNTITATLANQNANMAFAGPSTGTATTPTVRALVANDLPAHTHTINNINNVSLSSPQSGDILQYNGTSFVNTKPSNLYSSSGMNLNLKTITANYTATNSDFTIFANLSFNITITLPDAVANKGQILFIIIQSGFKIFSATIQPSNSQKIDGATSYQLGGGAPYRGQTLQSDGSNWYFIPTF